MKIIKLSDTDVKNICKDCSLHHADKRFSKIKEIEFICTTKNAINNPEKLAAELKRRFGIYGFDDDDLCDPRDGKYTAGYDHSYLYYIEYWSDKFNRTEWFYLYEFCDPDTEDDEQHICGYAIIS